MTQQLNQGDLFRESGGFCEVARHDSGACTGATSLKILWGVDSGRRFGRVRLLTHPLWRRPCKL